MVHFNELNNINVTKGKGVFISVCEGCLRALSSARVSRWCRKLTGKKGEGRDKEGTLIFRPMQPQVTAVTGWVNVLG